jgi:predicted NBD/HSP70 family sugar kinase
MKKSRVNRRVIGIDPGDRFSHLCVLDARGEVVERSRIRTTPAAYRKRFGGLWSSDTRRFRDRGHARASLAGR